MCLRYARIYALARKEVSDAGQHVNTGTSAGGSDPVGAGHYVLANSSRTDVRIHCVVGSPNWRVGGIKSLARFDP